MEQGYLRPLQSFYVLVDPTIRMVLGVVVIGMAIGGIRLLPIISSGHPIYTRSPRANEHLKPQSWEALTLLKNFGL